MLAEQADPNTAADRLELALPVSVVGDEVMDLGDDARCDDQRVSRG
jgi:hypothetical protein